MAIAWAELAEDQNATSSGAATTASVTFATNSLALIWVTLRASTDPTAGSVTATGHSRTWTEVVRGGDPNRVGVLLRSMAATSTGTIDLQGPADTLGMTWVVFEATGVITGNNGADAITDATGNGGNVNGHGQP